MTGRTLVDKIWDLHVITEVDEGLDLLHVDRHYVHEMTSPRAFTALSERGVGVLSPELTFGSPEHSVTILPGRTEASNPMSEKFVPLLRRNFAAHDLTLFDIDSPDHGIVHVIGRDDADLRPDLHGEVADRHPLLCGECLDQRAGEFDRPACAGVGSEQGDRVQDQVLGRGVRAE